MRLTEQELAARVGLGRTPVREAVQRLVADGLLVVFPRKGMTVAAINPLDVLLALDVRAALERVVAVAAATPGTPAQRARLRAIGRGMVEAAARATPRRYMRRQELRRGDRQASGNPFAVRALAPLQSMARRAWYYFRRERDLVVTAAHHAARGRRPRGEEADAAAASDPLIAHVRRV